MCVPRDDPWVVHGVSVQLSTTYLPIFYLSVYLSRVSLLLADLLRELELLLEALEARAAEVERDAQQHLARGERGVVATARGGLAVHASTER